MSAPIPITAPPATAPPTAAPSSQTPATIAIPADVPAQIQAAFEARKQIPLALAGLQNQRSDLGRTTAIAYSTGVAANGVDPAKAVIAYDAWETKDTQFSTQQDALKELLELVEAAIKEFKHTNPVEVSAVLRDQITALSESLTDQEKTEHATERQLILLWDELRDVDPGCLATMAKEVRMRIPDEPKKLRDEPKPTGKK